MAGPLRERNSLEISTRVEGTKHVQVGSGDAAVEFDEAVDGFGAAVVRAASVEVAQERVTPLSQGLAESGDLGDRAGGESGQDPLGELPAGGRVGGVVHGSDALGALPCDVHLVVAGVGGDRFSEAVLLARGQVLGTGAEDGPDLVQRVVSGARTMTARVQSGMFSFTTTDGT